LKSISEVIDSIVLDSIKSFDGSYNIDSPFGDLLSFGELVDRLSIVNFKLFTLKDRVMDSDDTEFKALASVEDVRLVEERARLKKCIDEKLCGMISTMLGGDDAAGFNPEVKKYGNRS